MNTIEGLILLNNSAENLGGGVYLGSYPDLSLTEGINWSVLFRDSYFWENRAGREGGGLYLSCNSYFLVY
jgi:hypothetical protein